MQRHPIDQMADDLRFEEKEPYENGFASYFHDHLRKLLARVEKKRRRQIFYFRLRSALLIAGILFLLGLGAYALTHHHFNKIQESVLTLAGSALVIMVYFWSRHPLKRYQILAKTILLPPVFHFFGAFDYNPKGRLSKTILKQCRLFEAWQKCEFEDHIEGKYEGISLEIAEVTLKRRKRKDKYVVLKELVLVFYLGRKLKGETILTSDKEHLNPSVTEDLDPLSLNHDYFPEYFHGFTNDQGEAEELLSKEFGKGLGELLKLDEVVDISCNFFDNKLVVRIGTKQNLFEPRGIFHSALTTQDIEKFLRQAFHVLQIVKIFSGDIQILQNGSDRSLQFSRALI